MNRTTHPMRKSRFALSAIAVLAGAGSVCTAGADTPAWPAPDSVQAESAKHLRIDPIWSHGDPALLVRPKDPRLDGVLLITIEDLLATPRVSLSSQATATGIATSSGVRAAVLGCGEATGVWALAAVRVTFDGVSRPLMPEDEVRASRDEFDDLSYSVTEQTRANQVRLLLFASAHQEWENPLEHLLPQAFHKSLSSIAVMSAAYPTPGAAGLLLIAGGCALGRRRR